MHRRTAHVRMNGPDATVNVDGADLSHATRAYTIGHQVGHQPQLLLDVRLDEVTIKGEMTVEVPEATAAALVALGWTPPDDQPIGGGEQRRAWLHQCGRLVSGTDEEFCPGCRFDVKPNQVEARYVLVPTVQPAAQRQGGPSGEHDLPL